MSYKTSFITSVFKDLLDEDYEITIKEQFAVRTLLILVPVYRSTNII